MFVYQCTSFITSLRRTTLTKTAFSLKSGALNINYVTLISCDRCLFIISYVWEKLNLEKKKPKFQLHQHETIAKAPHMLAWMHNWQFLYENKLTEYFGYIIYELHGSSKPRLDKTGYKISRKFYSD